MQPRYDRKQVLSWAMYDWANSAFATTVMAGFFPIFFKQYWSSGVDPHVSTFYLGAANSAAGIAVALLAPLFGSIADCGRNRKVFLCCFAALGVTMTGSLCMVPEGGWAAAAAVYTLAVLGFSGGNVFYDSFLVSVAPREHTDTVSALGYGLGYLGGGLLFALNVAMVLKPELFGFASSAGAVKTSFLTVAVWWAFFALPLVFFVREDRSDAYGGWRAVRQGLRQLVVTLNKIRSLRNPLLFLIGYWLYIDGVDTIILMAVDYGLSIGLDSQGLIIALLITQFVGFPAAIAFGRLGEKLGTKRSIFVGLAVYVAVTVWAYFMRDQREFYALAIAIGLVQGGVQALSRSLYSRLIPAESAAEFFGFYNMIGKFAAVIGPVLMGLVSSVTGNPRLAIFSVLALFVSGGLVLYAVRENA